MFKLDFFYIFFLSFSLLNSTYAALLVGNKQIFLVTATTYFNQLCRTFSSVDS